MDYLFLKVKKEAKVLAVTQKLKFILHFFKNLCPVFPNMGLGITVRKILFIVEDWYNSRQELSKKAIHGKNTGEFAKTGIIL